MVDIQPVSEHEANDPTNLWANYLKKRICKEAKTLPYIFFFDIKF
jgi:hypothetical protein